MRIVGTNIPDNKRVEIAITYIYGIGTHMARLILKEAKIDGKMMTKDLSALDVGKIQTAISKITKVEGELRQVVRQNIARLRDIKAYKGLRHMRRLPVRGQRTKSNSRTVRGNVRKTAGSGKRKVELK